VTLDGETDRMRAAAAHAAEVAMPVKHPVTRSSLPMMKFCRWLAHGHDPRLSEWPEQPSPDERAGER
jgi:hypothetical protein